MLHSGPLGFFCWVCCLGPPTGSDPIRPFSSVLSRQEAFIGLGMELEELLLRHAPLRAAPGTGEGSTTFGRGRHMGGEAEGERGSAPSRSAGRSSSMRRRIPRWATAAWGALLHAFWSARCLGPCVAVAWPCVAVRGVGTAGFFIPGLGRWWEIGRNVWSTRRNLPSSSPTLNPKAIKKSEA